MNAKPLQPQKSKPLIERFKRHSSDLEIYEAASLSDQQRKDLLTQPHTWIVVGKSRWN